MTNNQALFARLQAVGHDILRRAQAAQRCARLPPVPERLTTIYAKRYLGGSTLLTTPSGNTVRSWDVPRGRPRTLEVDGFTYDLRWMS